MISQESRIQGVLVGGGPDKPLEMRFVSHNDVIRAGEILNPENHKPSIEGIREMFTALKNHPKILSCTALQTVGSKGHDGLALVLVK